MKSVLGNSTIGFAFRLILAGVLTYAGVIKILEPHGARDAIMAYRLLPPSWAPLLGYILPAAEIGFGLLLLVGLFVRLSGLFSAVLMVLFIFGISSVWVRGYSIDCGCFGGGGDISPAGRAKRYSVEIVRDVLLGLMGLWLYLWPKTIFSLESSGTSSSD